MEIGDNIKKYRELRSITLPDLATRAGVSKAFLWEIESGKSKRPGAVTVGAHARAVPSHARTDRPLLPRCCSYWHSERRSGAVPCA